MKTVNITVPQSLTTLTSEELKAVAFNAINGRVGKDVLAEVLSKRLDTKRKINAAINQMQQNDLTNFYLSLKEASAFIDYTKTYFILTEPYRNSFTLKQ